MNDQNKQKPLEAAPSAQRLRELSAGDLNDLCDATLAAIAAGGGFGWVQPPAREALERYWEGVVAMPTRMLFTARLDHVICGSCQLVRPPLNNEAQAHAVNLTTHFIAPWARGYRLAHKLLQCAEDEARKEGFAVINLDVRETMEAAIKLYESVGFQRIGTHPHYAIVNGQTLKGYYYYKSL